MAIFKSLKTLIPKIPKTRTFLTKATPNTYLISSPFTPLFLNPNLPFLQPNPTARFLLPLSFFSVPQFQGPLFLSSTPWKLLQSSNPFHFRKCVVLRTLRVRNGYNLAFHVGSDLNLVSGRIELKESSDWFVESFVNLPNLVSLGRLVSGPVIGWMIVNGWYSAAVVSLAFSGATDWLDGYLARKMKIDSAIGSYLDPLADKVLIGCVALAMVHNDLLPVELVGLVVLRDALLVGGAIYKRASDLGWQWRSWLDFFNLDGTHREKIEPIFLSKVNTVLQLALVAGALLQPDFGTQETQLYLTYLSWLVASTTIGSTVGYGMQYMIKRSAPLIKSR